MIFYKLFRYLCFLILLTITGFYFFRTVELPYFSNLYNTIDHIYEEIPSNFRDENDTDLETLIIQNSLELLQEPQMIINDFFNNISTEYALEESMMRKYDNLAYLISEYLQHYDFFRDLVVYHNGIVIYKYSQFYSRSVIDLEYKKVLRNNNTIIVEFVFDLAMLQSKLNKINTRMYIFYDNKFLYGKHLQNVALTDIEKRIKPYQNSSKQQTSFYNSKNLYVHTITENLKSPLTLFIVSERSGFDIGYLLQILFILFFPAVFVLLVILDQVVFYKIKNSENSRAHSDNLKNIITNNLTDGDSLDWIDQWVELEDIVEKDILEKDDMFLDFAKDTEKNTAEKDDILLNSVEDVEKNREE